MSFSTFGTNLSNQVRLSVLIASSIALVISLAWNNAITSLIDNYIPKKYSNSKNAWFKVFYALALTFLAIIIVNLIAW